MNGPDGRGERPPGGENSGNGNRAVSRNTGAEASSPSLLPTARRAGNAGHSTFGDVCPVMSRWKQVDEAKFVAALSSIPPRATWLLKWELLADYIRPFEADWKVYADRRKYPNPVVLEVHPLLWKHRDHIKMHDGLLRIGFVEVDTCCFRQDAHLAEERLRVDRAERKRQRHHRREKQHVTWHIPSDTRQSPPVWRNGEKEENGESASVFSVSMMSGEGASSFCGTSASGDLDVASEPAPSERAPSEPSEPAPSSLDSVSLRDQLKELTRQVRILRAASLSSPPVKPPKPFIRGSYTMVTTGHLPVRLHVNFLDPDCAPYRVVIKLHSGCVSPTCSIVDHQYVVFIAPASPPGCFPVTLFGTSDTGQLRKYCPSVWIEYKTPDEMDACSDSGFQRTMSLHSPPSPTSRERQSCIKRTNPKTQSAKRLDRRGSVASCASSSTAFRTHQASPSNSRLPTPSADGYDPPHYGNGSVSSQPQKEGLTHHQINQHNAMEIPMAVPTMVDPSEVTDTVCDMACEVKSYSEMKSEFTSDMAEDEEAMAREEEEEEIYQSRQFRALRPPASSSSRISEHHPPLTKEMLELLTLGHGHDTLARVQSCVQSDRATRSTTTKSVNFATSRATPSLNAAPSADERSTSPIYAAPDAASSPSTRSLPVQSSQLRWQNGGTHSASSSASSSCSDAPAALKETMDLTDLSEGGDKDGQKEGSYPNASPATPPGPPPVPPPVLSLPGSSTSASSSSAVSTGSMVHHSPASVGRGSPPPSRKPAYMASPLRGGYRGRAPPKGYPPRKAPPAPSSASCSSRSAHLAPPRPCSSRFRETGKEKEGKDRPAHPAHPVEPKQKPKKCTSPESPHSLSSSFSAPSLNSTTSQIQRQNPTQSPPSNAELWPAVMHSPPDTPSRCSPTPTK